MLAIGNPTVWLVFLAAFVALSVRLARRRDWRDGFVLIGFLLAWVPWLVVGRTTFVSYMVPAVPFMTLVIAAAVRALPHRIAWSVGTATAAGAGATAVVYLPLWTAVPVSLEWFQRLGRLPGVL